MSDFAAHWAYRLMPEMRRQARLTAIRIVTADEPEAEWETFNAGLADLERHAHRLGASHMPEAYQRALQEELRRELVESITAVLGPWREAQLRADLDGGDQWWGQFAAWAKNDPVAAAAWTAKTKPTGIIQKSTADVSVEYVPEAPHRNITPEKPDNVPAEGSP